MFKFNKPTSKARAEFTKGIAEIAERDYDRRYAIRSLSEASDEKETYRTLQLFLDDPRAGAPDFCSAFTLCDSSTRWLKIASDHASHRQNMELAALIDLADTVVEELRLSITEACTKAVSKAQAAADEDGIAADTSSISSSYASEIENLPFLYGDNRAQFVNALAQRLGLTVTRNL